MPGDAGRSRRQFSSERPSARTALLEQTDAPGGVHVLDVRSRPPEEARPRHGDPARSGGGGCRGEGRGVDTGVTPRDGGEPRGKAGEGEKGTRRGEAATRAEAARREAQAEVAGREDRLVLGCTVPQQVPFPLTAKAQVRVVPPEAGSGNPRGPGRLGLGGPTPHFDGLSTSILTFSRKGRRNGPRRVGVDLRN